ncbi:hypothetical protein LXL04_023582 [Taraxacum kok-saghyz]
METFKVVVQGKLSMIRAREVIGWNPEFIDEEDESEDEDNETFSNAYKEDEDNETFSNAYKEEEMEKDESPNKEDEAEGPNYNPVDNKTCRILPPHQHAHRVLHQTHPCNMGRISRSNSNKAQ